MVWIPTYKQFKYQRAAELASPKIVFGGGSSMLYGIRSEIVEKTLERPAMNLGINGGITPRFFFEEIEKFLQAGDTVVYAPEYAKIEFNTYSRVDYEYFKSQGEALSRRFSLSDVLTYAFEVNVFDGTIAKATTLLRVLLKGGYGKPSELNQNGDYIGCQTAAVHIKESVIDLPKLVETFEFAPERLQSFRRFAMWAAEHQVRFFMTFPNLMKNPEYEKPAWRKASEDYRRMWLAMGINTLGEPTEFLYDRSFFCDSNYHLNSGGGAMRTQEFLVKYGSVLLAQ